MIRADKAVSLFSLLTFFAYFFYILISGLNTFNNKSMYQSININMTQFYIVKQNINSNALASVPYNCLPISYS